MLIFTNASFRMLVKLLYQKGHSRRNYERLMKVQHTMEQKKVGGNIGCENIDMCDHSTYYFRFIGR